MKSRKLNRLFDLETMSISSQGTEELKIKSITFMLVLNTGLDFISSKLSSVEQFFKLSAMDKSEPPRMKLF
jgi:hypothetical protein